MVVMDFCLSLAPGSEVRGRKLSSLPTIVSTGMIDKVPVDAIYLRLNEVPCLCFATWQYLDIDHVEQKMASTSDLEVIVIGAGLYSAASLLLD